MTVHLDSQWEQSMENAWRCQDVAFLSAGVIPPNHTEPSESDAEAEHAVSSFVLRQLLQSVGNSYIDLKTVKLNYGASSRVISAVFFQHDSKSVTENIKSIQSANDRLYLVSLTVFKDVYDKNKKYFDGILNSIEIK